MFKCICLIQLDELFLSIEVLNYLNELNVSWTSQMKQLFVLYKNSSILVQKSLEIKLVNFTNNHNMLINS